MQTEIRKRFLLLFLLLLLLMATVQKRLLIMVFVFSLVRDFWFKYMKKKRGFFLDSETFSKWFSLTFSGVLVAEIGILLPKKNCWPCEIFVIMFHNGQFSTRWKFGTFRQKNTNFYNRAPKGSKLTFKKSANPKKKSFFFSKI